MTIFLTAGQRVGPLFGAQRETRKNAAEPPRGAHGAAERLFRPRANGTPSPGGPRR
jgi:hypothetical protein